MAYTEAQARAIIADMLRQGEGAFCELLEMRRSPLSDLAVILATRAEEPTADAFRGLAADASLPGGAGYMPPAGVSDSYRSYLTAALSALSAMDRASLAAALAARQTVDGRSPTADALLSCRRLPGRCAYLRNPLSDEAYDLFSAELDVPTAMYVGDFTEACAAVSLGEADYCILPLTASDGRRAESVRHLARNHHLVASSVCHLLDGEDVPMHFALFGSAPRGGFSGEPVLSLFFPALTGEGLTALLNVAACLGAQVTRASADSTGEMTIRGGDMTAFLVYLCLFTPDFQVDGYYFDEERKPI